MILFEARRSEPQPLSQDAEMRLFIWPASNVNHTSPTISTQALNFYKLSTRNPKNLDKKYSLIDPQDHSPSHSDPILTSDF